MINKITFLQCSFKAALHDNRKMMHFNCCSADVMSVLIHFIVKIINYYKAVLKKGRGRGLRRHCPCSVQFSHQ